MKSTATAEANDRSGEEMTHMASSQSPGSESMFELEHEYSIETFGKVSGNIMHRQVAKERERGSSLPYHSLSLGTWLKTAHRTRQRLKQSRHVYVLGDTSLFPTIYPTETP